jgi:hypothetical protein
MIRFLSNKIYGKLRGVTFVNTKKLHVFDFLLILFVLPDFAIIGIYRTAPFD